MLKEILVPDIGSYTNVDIIEILVKPGDVIQKDSSLMTLETEKATLEIPAPFEGIVKDIHVKVGDKVSEGSLILSVEVVEVTDTVAKNALTEKSEVVEKEILVPDIGSYTNVDVIEVSVKPGDVIQKDNTLITLETEKATLEVPAPYDGTITAVLVKVGDKVSQGSLILKAKISLKDKPSIQPAASTVPQSAKKPNENLPPRKSAETEYRPYKNDGFIHAGPGVRRFARELGADLSRVRGTGIKGRILRQDVQAYVKGELSRLQSGVGPSTGGLNIAPWPQIDHAKFGEVQKEPLSRIKKLSGSYLHRNWVMVPHVTQFEEADITDLEKYRKDQQSIAEKEGVKLTPLVFIMKAVTAALKAHPSFNASLDVNGADLILKKYFHIGVAVDTPNGLVVPVVRNVEQKGIYQLAKELGEISAKAREGQLAAQDMQGSSFSISSLGGIGGTAFTPIINVPDVAILGVSKAMIKPIYLENEFKPRLMLPLSLSYDHRVIDGAEAARFITYLSKQLSHYNGLL